MKKLLFILFFLCLISPKVLVSGELEKTPLKSSALSLIIPGGGQFYNEKYLKAAIIFTLEGTVIGITGYHIWQANKNYDKYRSTLNEKYYEKYIDYYEKQQSDYFWLGTVVFLSCIDAFVDAHLYNFESEKKKIHLKFKDNYLSLGINF